MDSIQQLRSGRECKSMWTALMEHKGARIKLAVNDTEQAVGMIQYLPVHYTRVLGHNMYYIQCIWVHGYEQGIGNKQGRGVGTLLLRAAEKDARELSANGMAAWELSVPQYLESSWYQKNGYIEADRLLYDTLLWKPFTDNAQAPCWLRPHKIPQPVPGQVTVTALVTHWCPELSDAHLAQQVADEMGERVVYKRIDTTDPDVLHEWGIESAMYIDAERIYAGLTDYPPPSYGVIKDKINEHLAAKE
jgi:GNAT superfamily N-acetyltransferase